MSEVSLREYLEAQLGQLRAEYAHLRELGEVRREETMRALDLAAREVSERFTKVNELREQVLQERGMYPRRELFDALVDRMGRMERLVPILALASAIMGAVLAYGVLRVFGVS